MISGDHATIAHCLVFPVSEVLMVRLGFVRQKISSASGFPCWNTAPSLSRLCFYLAISIPVVRHAFVSEEAIGDQNLIATQGMQAVMARLFASTLGTLCGFGDLWEGESGPSGRIRIRAGYGCDADPCWRLRVLAKDINHNWVPRCLLIRDRARACSGSSIFRRRCPYESCETR